MNINISYNSQNSVNEIDNSSFIINGKKYLNEQLDGNMSRNINKDYYLQKLQNDQNKINNTNAPMNNTNDNQNKFSTLNNFLDKNNTNPNTINKNDTNTINKNDINNTLKKQDINTKKEPQNEYVCPLMINSPWSEFKSGDNVPEPYNL